MCLPLPYQDGDSYHSGEESFADIRVGSYLFISFLIILCHFDLFHIIACHLISFHVISYHFMSFHIISYRFYQPHFFRFDGTMRNDTCSWHSYVKVCALMLVKAQIPIGQVILFVVDGSAFAVQWWCSFHRGGSWYICSAGQGGSVWKDPSWLPVREMKKALHGSWQLSWSWPWRTGISTTSALWWRLHAKWRTLNGSASSAGIQIYGDREDATETGESGSAEEG